MFSNNTETPTDDLAKIDEWKKIIQDKLMPKII
jgi:hypothetical protein